MTKEQIFDLAQGNFGALRVLMEMTEAGFDELLSKFEQLGIRGSDIWVLYKDLCGSNILRVADTMMRPPAGLLQMIGTAR